MLQRRWLAFTWGVCVAVAVGAGGGCSSKDRAAAAGNPNDSLLRIDVAPASVVADGKNTVTVTVTAATGAVNLTSTKGLFVRGSQLLTLQPGETTATLTTCDSVADKTCAGNAVISATDSSTTLPKTKNVTFTQAEICDNGIDDDAVPATSPGSGKTDCFDPACLNQMCRVGGGGADSGVPTMGVCGSNGVCTCVNEMPESCTDDMDNNCNGKIDCADAMCSNQPCTLSMTTQGLCSASTGKCECPKTAENCSNMVDDDCDGLTDCQDPDCQGDGGALSCASASGGLISLTAPQTYLPADGTSTVPLTAYVRNSAGGPLAGQAVTFALDPGSVGALAPTMATTDSSGRATVTFTASSTAGDATIRASYMAGAAAVTSDPVKLSMPQIGQMVFVSQQFPQMGNRGSNYNETNDLVFQVLYSNTTPYPPGLTVSFTHASLSESFLGVAPTCSTITTGGIASVQCTATGVTDAMGMVHILLHSGDSIGTVTVTATAQAGGSVVTASSPGISIIGGQASGSNFDLKCTPYNVPALLDTNCSYSKYSGKDADPITCVVTVGNRSGPVLTLPTKVAIASEAGLPDESDMAALSTGNTGIARIKINVLNGHLPLDVDPVPGEYSYTYQGCGGGVPTIHNPRDGLVTIIASAHGEEGYTDTNRNGKYDLGENFVDLAEPFVDANDNNVWDNNEFFIDSDNSMAWDPPNGVWDSSTTIWATTRVVYTGQPAYAIDSSGLEYFSRWANGPLASPAPTQQLVLAMSSGTTLGTMMGESRFFYALFTDENFNIPSSFGDIKVTAGAGMIQATQDPGAITDSRGMGFAVQFCDKQDGTGACSSVCAGELLSSGARPCYARTTIGPYASWLSLRAKATCPAMPDASDEVDANYTNNYNKETRPTLALAGVCK